MPRIMIETGADAARLASLGVERWPVWEKEVSEFPWTYDAKETSYLLAGRVIVTPDGGAPVEIAAGDLVTFPAGMRCTWKVVEPLRKHYRLG
jgi:uncharacterized cupin superfamily protein